MLYVAHFSHCQVEDWPFAAVISRSAHSHNIFSMLWAKIFDSQTTRFASASQGEHLAGVCGASMDAKDWTENSMNLRFP